MKNLKLVFVIIASMIVLSSCADKKTIDGRTYRPYGVFNDTKYKNDAIQYEVSGWAVFSGILWSETVVVPIYVFGYHLWQPIGKKTDFINNPDKGVVN